MVIKTMHSGFVEDVGYIADCFHISPNRKVKFVYGYNFDGNIVEIVQEIL